MTCALYRLQNFIDLCVDHAPFSTALSNNGLVTKVPDYESHYRASEKINQPLVEEAPSLSSPRLMLWSKKSCASFAVGNLCIASLKVKMSVAG